MRRREWAAILGVGVCAVYALFRVATQYWDYGTAAGELPDAVRDYRTAGLPWTAADIAMRVAPEDNAAPLVRQAIAAMPKKELDAFNRARIEGAPLGAMTAFARALRLAHLAAVRPRLDFARDWDQGHNLLMPEPGDLRSVCRVLAARAVRRAAIGDDDAALADLEDARRLSNLVGNEPTMIAALVSKSCEAIALAGTQQCLVSANGSAGRLERYRRWLATPPSLPNLQRALRGEIYLSLVFARNLDRFGMGKGLLPMSDYEPFVDTVDDMQGIQRPTPTMRREGFPTNTRSQAYMARGLQLWTDLSRSTNGLSDPMEDISRRSQEIEDRYSKSKGMSYQFGPVLFPVFSEFGKTNRRTQASRAVTGAFAEALIEHAKTGRWPTTFATPDPMGKGSLRTRFDGRRFRVWSAGRNGVDDGGLTSREAYAVGKKSDDEVAAYPPIPAKVPRTAPLLSPGPGMTD